MNSRELRALLVVSPDEKIALALADEVNEMAKNLDHPRFQPWIARGFLKEPRVRNALIYAKVPFLSVNDPFRW